MRVFEVKQPEMLCLLFDCFCVLARRRPGRARPPGRRGHSVPRAPGTFAKCAAASLALCPLRRVRRACGMTEAYLNGNGHAPTGAADVSKLSKEAAALKEQVKAMDDKLAERLKRKPPVRIACTFPLPMPPSARAACLLRP